MKPCPQCNTKCLNQAVTCDCGYVFHDDAPTSASPSTPQKQAERLSRAEQLFDKTSLFGTQRTTKKKRIAHISIHQTSKVLAILYVVLGLLFIPIGVILIISGQMVMGIVYVLMPFIYGILGYPLAAGMCWVYNMIAKSVGGIEFTVEDNDHAA